MYIPNGLTKAWAKGKHFVARRPCAICSSLFYCSPSVARRPNGGKYCSYRCAGISRKKKFQIPMTFLGKGHRQTKTCLSCGREHYRKTKFCSKACYDRRRSETLRKPNSHALVNCLCCKKEFLVLVWYLKKGLGKYCSRSCFGRDKVNHITFHRSVGGKREDLGGMYFRSRWEANWARYLNWMKARKEILYWKYEPDTFEFKSIKRGSKFYTPDFMVVNPDGTIEYHEVKGWMDAVSSTKLRRMAKFYPSIKIVLVDKVMYKQVRNAIGPLIENWEQEDSHFKKFGGTSHERKPVG